MTAFVGLGLGFALIVAAVFAAVLGEVRASRGWSLLALGLAVVGTLTLAVAGP